MPKATPRKTLDDDALVQDALDGKSEAFGQLMRKHRRRLFALAMRMLHNREESEDVIQQAFMEAYRHLSGFRHSAQFSTWLYSITLNRSRNYLRHRRSRQWVAIGDIPSGKGGGVPFQLADASPTPEQILEKQFDLDRIRRQVRLLPGEYRDIFTLHYFQNLPLQEISLRLGRPLGTIKVYLHRARKELTRAFDSSPPEG